MSRIFRELVCEHCKQEYKDLWISFGHPEKDFQYEWQCEKCAKQNILEVKAMPRKSDYTW
jgi:hypothetical protein